MKIKTLDIKQLLNKLLIHFPSSIHFTDFSEGQKFMCSLELWTGGLISKQSAGSLYLSSYYAKETLSEHILDNTGVKLRQ